MQYSSTVVVYFTFCVLLSSANKDCSLYEDFDGSRCFWGDEITAALTWSPTLWVVEFYSSWCGHCQHFAPVWKEMATRVKGWSSVVRVGEIDCSKTENSQICRSYQIMAYPSIKFVPPKTNNPTSSTLQEYAGARSADSMVKFILNYLLKTNALSTLEPLKSNSVPEEIVCIVFEHKDSYTGMMIMLDLKDVQIRRVTNENTALVDKYCVLYFPSLVFLLSGDKYTVLSGKSIENKDVADHFMKKIREFVGSTLPSSKEADDNSNQINQQPHPLFNQYVHVARPTIEDIRSAISYSLRMEVMMYKLISDKRFIALLRFVTQLEKTFQFSHSSIAHDMRLIRNKLQSRSSAGFIITFELERILEFKLNADLFPIEPKWSSCSGSKPQYRGYPCGLWSLMHTVTILSLSLHSSTEYRPAGLLISSRESIYSMVGFVKNFFSCEECRKHFTKLAEDLRVRPINFDGDAILWLWEAHNIVNKRLKDYASSDPAHPKVLFPPYQLCPDCYILVGDKHGTFVEPSWDNVGFASGERKLELDNLSRLFEYHWNKTAVFLFLTNFYGMGYFNDVTSSALLSSAWPRQFPATTDRFPHKIQSSYNNSALFFVQFLVCVVIIAFLMMFTLRHKMSWRSSRPGPSLSRFLAIIMNWCRLELANGMA